MACVGHQSAGLWRHPEDHGYRYRELGYWTELARILEAGGFDALFLADVLGVYDVYGASRDAAVIDAAQFPVNDPTAAVSAMAAVTESLGFGITLSLTYEQPYALARRLSTLDHLTGGRVAWNIVTSYLDSAARNLGLNAQIPHDQRYEIADEYLEVCYKLWEASWESDAVVRDPERGVFTDPAKVHDIEHKGKYFSVPGPFLCEPSPQRTPVLFQAGASPRGVRFAAAHAEAVFVSGPTPQIVRGPVRALRTAAAELGRDPGSIKVFTMVTPVVAETHGQAVAKLAEYRKFVSAGGALALFGGWTGVDLAQLDPDDPLRYVETNANRSALASFTTGAGAHLDGAGIGSGNRHRWSWPGTGRLARRSSRRTRALGRGGRCRRVQPGLRDDPRHLRRLREIRCARASSPRPGAGSRRAFDASRTSRWHRTAAGGRSPRRCVPIPVKAQPLTSR